MKDDWKTSFVQAEYITSLRSSATQSWQPADAVLYLVLGPTKGSLHEIW